MKKKTPHFLAAIAAVLSLLPPSAHAAGTVATVPTGIMTLAIKSGTANYLSIPLLSTATYTTTVASVTTTAITVDDTPAPFTGSLAVAGSPYFVKFLTGNEVGRVMLITRNTTNSVTLDTTDHTTGSAVALTATGFNVEVGDTFEIFPGDTLASIFGENTASSPLVLASGTTATADTVGLCSTAATPTNYYFNAATNHWSQVGTAANANNIIIYPYSAFVVNRLANHPATTLSLNGRVTQVNPAMKVVGRGSVFTSTHLAVNVKLSQLQFSNWVEGATITAADNLSVWNATLNQFDVYYQKPDATWRKYPDATTDQSNFTIAAGTVTKILKRAAATGAAAFLQTNLPYTVQ
jgi:uncharacterized protein (TIGR02597 family)